MIRMVAMLAVMIRMISALPASFAADIDRTAVDFITPAEMGPATSTPAEKR